MRTFFLGRGPSSAAARLQLAAVLAAWGAAGQCRVPSTGAPVSCPYGPPRCYDGNAPSPGEPMPVNLTVAFYGDASLNQASRDVMALSLAEGAELIIHAGDFDYACNSPAFDNNIRTAGVPDDFPYMAAGGNHDIDDPGSTSSLCQTKWSHPTTGYQKMLYDRMIQSAANCSGEVGINQVCTYKGLTFVMSGVGSQGARSEDFITQAFAQYGDRWRFCSWHKNQHDLQLGGKSNEVGWDAFERCRMSGAFVMNGHEHSYSRTYTLSHFESKTVVDTNASEVAVDFDESFLFVNGVGGQGTRVCQNGAENNPWWASAHCAATNLLPGTVICKFNLNGDADRAYCFFKQIDGQVRDEWYITSRVPAYTPAPVNATQSCNLVYQVGLSSDDAEQDAAGGTVDCTSSDLELVTESAEQVVGIRFERVDLSPRDLPLIRRARLQFESDEVSVDPTSLTIRAHASSSSPTFCSSGVDIISRQPTTAAVQWSNIDPWSDVSVDHFSPDVTPLLQELVQRGDWVPGSPVTFLITGTGRRTAESHDGSCGPILYIEKDCPTSTTGGAALTTGAESPSTTAGGPSPPSSSPTSPPPSPSAPATGSQPPLTISPAPAATSPLLSVAAMVVAALLAVLAA